MDQKTPNFKTEDRLIDLLTPILLPLGYEIIHLEIQTHREKILRLYIDRTEEHRNEGAIGVQDCSRVSHALDLPMEEMPEIEAAFHGAYELEVSSPGVDRPLRRTKDFERFTGQEIRVHTYRPLSTDELENPGYQQKNPKQKNFVGVLKGISNDKVKLEIPAAPSKDRKRGKDKKRSDSALTNSVEVVMIPFPLISKANLEPNFDLAGEAQKKE